MVHKRYHDYILLFLIYSNLLSLKTLLMVISMYIRVCTHACPKPLIAHIVQALYKTLKKKSYNMSNLILTYVYLVTW